MGNDYYGYNSADNHKLTELRMLGRHTGENLTKYDNSDLDSSFEGYQATYRPQGSNPGALNSKSNYDYHNTKDGYGRTGASGSGVEAIYHRLMAQDPGKVQALIEHWQRIATALDDVMHEIQTKSDGMSKSWVSPGASQFLALGPGAALKSVSDWQLAATSTAIGLQHLYGALVAQQTKIAQVYQQYTSEVGVYQAKIQNWKTGKAGITGAQDLKDMPGHFEEVYTKEIADIQTKYTWQAQVIESDLADAYWDSYNAVAGSTPGIYEGPTNAVVAPPALFVTPPNGPGSVGGGPPPSVYPGAPSVPSLIAPGANPAAPHVPVKPGAKVPSPVVAKPVAPQAPGPVAAPTQPAAPVPPGAPSILPAATAGAAAFLTKPTITKPNAPPAPSPPGGSPNPSLPTSPSGVSKALAKGVLKPGAAESPDLPPSPGRGGRAGAPNPAGTRRAKRSTSSVLRSSAEAEPELPPSAGQARRPGTQGSQGNGGVELPGSPFPGRAASITPPVLGGRTTQRPPGAGQGRAGTPAELPPLPPGATKPVLSRPEPTLPRGNEERSRVGRGTTPGGLVGPLALGPLTMPTNPVLNRPTLAGRPASSRALGVPEGLRGATGQGEQAPARGARPVARPDLAARRVNRMSAPQPEVAEERPVNDVEAFSPETPGGPVLTQSATDPTDEPGPRIALPGSG